MKKEIPMFTVAVPFAKVHLEVDTAIRNAKTTVDSARCIKPGCKRSDIYKQELMDCLQEEVGALLVKQLMKDAEFKKLFAAKMKAQMKAYDKCADASKKSHAALKTQKAVKK